MDNFNLILDFGDDTSPALMLRSKGTFKIGLNPGSGTITADNFSGLAAKATGDADGNAIKTTYAKLASPAFSGTPTAPT